MSPFGRAEIEAHDAALLLVDVAREHLVAMSRGFCQLMGMVQFHSTNAPWNSLFDPADLQILAAERAVDVETHRLDGAPLRLRMRVLGTPVASTDGQPHPHGDPIAVTVQDVTDLVLAGYTDRAIALIALAGQSASSLDEYDGLFARALVLSGLADRAASLEAQPESQSLVLRAAVGWPPGIAENLAALAFDDLEGAGENACLRIPGASGNSEEPAMVLAVPIHNHGALAGVVVVEPVDLWPAAPNTHSILDVSRQSRDAVRARQAEATRHSANDARLRTAGDARRGLEVLERTLAALDFSQPLAALFADLMKSLSTVVEFGRAMLCEEISGRDAILVRARYAPGDFVPVTGTLVIEMSGGPATEAIRSRRVVTATVDASANPNRYVQSLIRAGFTKWCAAPMLLGEDLHGALLLARKESRPHFTPGDLRTVRGAATLLALCARAARSSSRSADRPAVAGGRAREQIQAAERSRVVGGMVRRLAQMLGTHIDIALDRLETALCAADGTPAAPHIASAVDEVEECADVMRKLRVFASRAGLENPQPVELGDVLRAAVDRVLARQREARGDGFAAFDLDLELGDPVTILGEATLLTDAFAAVLDNAFESMPRGGTISVSLTRGGRWVRLLVTDVGVGVGSSLWGQISEPFFTTRGALANGLGLSFVDGVVAQHGGVLLLTSDLRVGTTFAIYLPLPSTPAGPPQPNGE